MRVKNVGKIGLTLFFLIVLVTSCTRDNTDHPNHAKITSLAVDWSNRGAGINIPESYTVRIGEYSAIVSGTVCCRQFANIVLTDNDNYTHIVFTHDKISK